MICLGYRRAEKLYWLKKIVDQNTEIKNIVVFSPPKFAIGENSISKTTGLETVEYTYDDIIMYKVFYPLLERVDDSYLVVINECMCTRERNCLTYNCLNHYLNQTSHRLVFEYLPFVVDTSDTMILLDRELPHHFKGRGYDAAMLKEVNMRIAPHHYNLTRTLVQLPDGAGESYEKEKERLFDDLGNGDPDNIPRRLHVWCGKFKKTYVNNHPELEFVARNARFKSLNVTTFKQATDGHDRILLDIPHRQIDFNMYLKISGVHDLNFVTTGLNVDEYYYRRTAEWIQRLEDFYEAAGICF